MAVEVTLSNGSGTIGDVIGYTVSEDATPLVIGDSSGSVGKIEVEAKSKNRGPIFTRSGGIVGSSVLLTDQRSVDGTPVVGHGSIAGQVTEAGIPGERINFSADTVLNRLNTDRKADPFYGSFIPAQTTSTTRTNVNPNPSRETNVTGVAVNNGGANGAGTITRVTEPNYSGYFARMTYTTNGTGVGGGIEEQINVVGGTSYSLSARYRVTRAATLANGAVAQNILIVMRFYTAANGSLNESVVVGNVIQGQWTTFTVAAIAPTNAAYVKIFTVASANGSLWKIGDTIDSDYVILEAGAGGAYFDGSTPTSDVTDPYTGIRTQKTYAWSGVAHASSSTETTSVTLPPTGYDATQGNAFRYYCSLVDIQNVVIDPDFENRPVAYPGWEGNVWTHIKEFAASVQAEVALVNGVVTMRKPRLYDVPIESISNPVMSISSVNSAQFVEVVNQNSRWGRDEVAYSPTSVYSVDTSGFTQVEVSIPHFLGSVNSPEMVTSYTIDYDAGPGQYMVLDSQGLIVAPDWWKKYGGRVEVSMGYDSFTDLVINIYGPNSQSTSYIGPFKIGRFITPSSGTEQGEIAAAMDITGRGVFVDPVTVRIRTGVNEQQTSAVVSSPINSVFITSADIAYTRGLDAACAAAGPVVTLTGTINNFAHSGQQFGILAGSRIRYGGNIFRITNTSVSMGGVAFTALADMTFSDMIDLYSYTFGDFNAVYPTLTFSQFNTLQSGKTFATFNSSIGTPDFEDFNTVFAGATFNDHTIYPYLAEAPIEEAPTF